jgi:D-3-phosphoglycerate dehydrogenase / 2-oxoglutarate reductase
MAARILVTDAPWGDLDIERKILEAAGCEVIAAPDQDESTLIRIASDVDAIATCWCPVPASVIEAAPHCRHIARLGIGLDNIDIAAATRAGMVVTNVPDYCIEEVAHHALGLLLVHARRIAFFHLRTKRGEYELQAAGSMRRLCEQTLGLIGFGHIGRRLREMALGIGLSVIAHTPSADDYGTGCEMVPLEELLQRSDYVSIHVPLTDQTQHLLDAAALATMKPDAFVINTSRGAVIDQEALWESLQNNRLGGAGLDVFDPEPPDLTEPLFQDERVILTPHAAFMSHESLVELRTRVAGQILDVLAGRTPENVVHG